MWEPHPTPDGGGLPLVFACAGASYVGRLSHTAACRLEREGHGVMACLAGVGAGLAGFIEPARRADHLVVLDGCQLRCALKVILGVGAEPTVHFVLTHQGIQSSPENVPTEDDVQRVAELVISQLENKG